MLDRVDGVLVDDGDDGTEGETGDEVSFGEVAMEVELLEWFREYLRSVGEC